MRLGLKTLLIGAAIATCGCAGYGAGDQAADAACAARESACIRECDEAFERRPNSWDYAECTDRCRAARGPACP